MSNLITLGYFGVPGRDGGLTHLVHQDTHKTLCGTRFHPQAEYQGCFPPWKYGPPPECERCKKILSRMYAVFLAEEAAKLPSKPRKPRAHHI